MMIVQFVALGVVKSLIMAALWVPYKIYKTTSGVLSSCHVTNNGDGSGTD